MNLLYREVPMAVVSGILTGLGILLGLIVLYLVTIIFFPVLKEIKQPMKKSPETPGLPGESRDIVNRLDIEYPVEGTTVRGWLYLSEGAAGRVPGIVMSHGFGGTKDCLLEKYALRFNREGYAVLTYDYRSFGESGGEPRQNYHLGEQLSDLRGAVAFLRGREEIDPEQIVLWGTSAAGSYGLTVAAEDPGIAGVIAQCAGLDHKKDGRVYMEREGFGYMLRLVVHAQRDKGRSRFGFSPHHFPIAGRAGTFGMFRGQAAFEGYEKLTASSGTFRNEVCARLLLMPHGGDPAARAGDVTCPVLILACEKDELVAPDSYAETARILGDLAVVKTYPIGHFDIYQGENFERAVSDMSAFLGDVFSPREPG